MNPTSETKRTFWVVLAIALVYSFCYRIVPGWTIPNLAPIGALAFYCGYASNRLVFSLIPLALMAITDTVLRFTVGYPAIPSVYVCMFAYSLLGIVGANRNWGSRIALLVTGSLFFFVVTNFDNWLMSRVPADQIGGASYLVQPSAIYTFEIKYADNFMGLLANYAMALGFLAKTILSDVGFTAVLALVSLSLAPRFALQKIRVRN